MSKKILIADDESHILHVVSMKLKNAGYSVVSAMDGEEALELASTERPDLIITDYQMPVVTGLELCRQLRVIRPDRDTPIIMLTARGFDMDLGQLGRLGVSTVITKPFSPRELLDKVEQLLAKPTSARNA